MPNKNNYTNGGSGNYSHEGQALLPSHQRDTIHSQHNTNTFHIVQGRANCIRGWLTLIGICAIVFVISYYEQTYSNNNNTKKNQNDIFSSKDVSEEEESNNKNEHGNSNDVSDDRHEINNKKLDHGPVRGIDAASEEHYWWLEDHVDVSVVTLPGDEIILQRPIQQDQLRWGILGLGRIAEDFTTALKMTGATITAVAAGSLPNTKQRAQDFAQRFHIETFYGSYEELANDPNIDIVYIATIHPLHYNNTILMLEAGKNVLVEKPMAMTYQEAKHMAQIAQDQQLLLQVNYWSRFFPVMKYARSILEGSQKQQEKDQQQISLGSIVSMRGDFGFATPPDPLERKLNRKLGGGAILDIGCYLVDMAVMVHHSQTNLTKENTTPTVIQALGQSTYLGKDYKVDTESGFLLQWQKKNDDDNLSQNNNMIMAGQASFQRPSAFEVEIDGTHGRLVLHTPANAVNASTIYQYDPFGPKRHVTMVRSEMPQFDTSYTKPSYPRGAGFVYIIQDIEDCMQQYGIPRKHEEEKEEDRRDGCRELSQLPMKEQLLTVQITDDILDKIGYWDW